MSVHPFPRRGPVVPDVEVIGETIYLDGRAVAVFLPHLNSTERRSAEEALGLRLPHGR